ncbi:hypothetical protein COI41_15560 [Bacillus toyonensis]|uniref:hypothetical protein n=1 Tax=Bacillus toyonensis TaxID=155322 RepID=UPI000BFB9533|nr:hypothetical protein [Bacillus toyonensis]PHF53907.1 hypothetical protein COI41_15560 [Bacillus toyonensis]
MAKLYYSKVNVNSNIHDVDKGIDSIESIMDRLYKALDDEKEYVKTLENTFEGDNGELKTVISKEIYNFSQLEKVETENQKYITGWVVKRTPVFAEEFDSKKRVSKKVVRENDSISTMFYFDLQSEIVSFYSRLKFGHKQVNDAFESLLDTFMEDIGFKVFLIKNPFSLREIIQMLHKVNKIETTIIPPNAVNREALKKLFEKENKPMAEANLTKKTISLETHVKNNKGMNIDSTLIKETLEVSEAYMEFGYSSVELEGETKEGNRQKYISDKDSPYQTDIPDEVKEDRANFIDFVQKGINKLLTKMTIEKYKKGETVKTEPSTDNKEK